MRRRRADGTFETRFLFLSLDLPDLFKLQYSIAEGKGVDENYWAQAAADQVNNFGGEGSEVGGYGQCPSF
jgi:hypothetical protein